MSIVNKHIELSRDLEISHSQTDNLVHLRVRGVGDRRKNVIICVVDTSSSMNMLIENVVADSPPYTRLDLVKHSLRTIFKSLNNGDYFGIVTFATEANVILNPKEITDDNKLHTDNIIEGIRAFGSTNLWDGLKTSIDLMRENVKANYNGNIFVLTDGLSNIDPPRGVISTLKRYLGEMDSRYSVNLFGYGYNLDSELLWKIANMMNGIYGFIPDASMIGTIFVNAMANVLSRLYTRLTIETDERYVRVIGYDNNYGSININETKHIMLEVHDCDEINVRVYGDNELFERFLVLNQNDLNFDEYVKYCRLARVPELIKSLMKDCDLSEFETFYETCKGYDSLENLRIDLKSDDSSEGQVWKAISNREWFDRWGKHYLPAFALSHRYQVCLNFRDKSIQEYGGELFNELKDTIEGIFCELPAPNATGHGMIENVSGRFSMGSIYHSPICMEGDVKVLTMTGLKSLEDVKQGDYVRTPDAFFEWAQVNCIVKTHIHKETSMSNINGCWITPWHPIRPHKEKEWIFPHDHDNASKYVDYVYNLILNSHHTVTIYNKYNKPVFDTVTLGHGKTNGILAHPYFGTQKVIDDMINYDIQNFKKGYIELKEYEIKRDENNLICSITKPTP